MSKTLDTKLAAISGLTTVAVTEAALHIVDPCALTFGTHVAIVAGGVASGLSAIVFPYVIALACIGLGSQVFKRS